MCWAVLGQLESWVHGHRQPDLTFLFDVPPEVAEARRAAVRQPDRFEAQDVAFFIRVRQAYERRRAAQPDRFALIDATQASDSVGAQVLSNNGEGAAGVKPVGNPSWRCQRNDRRGVIYAEHRTPSTSS